MRLIAQEGTTPAPLQLAYPFMDHEPCRVCLLQASSTKVHTLRAEEFGNRITATPQAHSNKENAKLPGPVRCP